MRGGPDRSTFVPGGLGSWTLTNHVSVTFGRCAAVLAMVGALAGCGGGGDGQAPGTPARISIVSGNAQSVVQHRRLSADLVVRVVDGLGTPLPDVPITLAPATGSPAFTTDWPEFGRIGLPKATSSDGTFKWAGYFNTVGSNRVQVSVDGVPPVVFDVEVTPSAHALDGVYQCFGSSMLVLVDGVVDSLASEDMTGFNYFFTQGRVDEATGALAATLRTSLDFRYELSGTLSTDAQGAATGAGTYVETAFGKPTAQTGTWTCTRI